MIDSSSNYQVADQGLALKTEYCCLLGVAPGIPGMPVGNMTTVYNRGFSFMVTALPDQTFFFVNIKLAEPLKWPSRGRYTLEEANKEAARYASMPVTDNMLFGELWKRRIRGHLYPLEEGILKLWHFDQTVLVGDCVHKVGELLCILPTS